MLVVIVIVETSAFDDEMGGWKTYFILFHSFCKRPHPWTFDFWTFNSMRPPPKSELDPNGNTLLYDQRIKEIFCSAPFRRVVFLNLMVRRGPSLSWICTQLPPKSELDPDSPVIPSASKETSFPSHIGICARALKAHNQVRFTTCGVFDTSNYGSIKFVPFLEFMI